MFIRLLVVLAIVLRGIVPAGFMPANDGNGGMELVICTGHGIQVVPDGKPSQPGHKSPDSNSVCPFAASAPLAIAAAFAEPPVLSQTQGETVSPLTEQRLLARADGAAQARAPPSRQA